jgi:hypothetical protein
VAYPDVVEAITKWLEHLHEVAAPITLVTVHGIVVATILKMALEKIFHLNYLSIVTRHR